MSAVDKSSLEVLPLLVLQEILKYLGPEDVFLVLRNFSRERVEALMRIPLLANEIVMESSPHDLLPKNHPKCSAAEVSKVIEDVRKNPWPPQYETQYQFDYDNLVRNGELARKLDNCQQEIQNPNGVPQLLPDSRIPVREVGYQPSTSSPSCFVSKFAEIDIPTPYNYRSSSPIVYGISTKTSDFLDPNEVITPRIRVPNPNGNGMIEKDSPITESTEKTMAKKMMDFHTKYITRQPHNSDNADLEYQNRVKAYFTQMQIKDEPLEKNYQVDSYQECVKRFDKYDPDSFGIYPKIT